jgi:hypothetical protein
MILAIVWYATKLVNLSHLACQIHSKIFTKLWLVKSLYGKFWPQTNQAPIPFLRNLLLVVVICCDRGPVVKHIDD